MQDELDVSSFRSKNWNEFAGPSATRLALPRLTTNYRRARRSDRRQDSSL